MSKNILIGVLLICILSLTGCNQKTVNSENKPKISPETIVNPTTEVVQTSVITEKATEKTFTDTFAPYRYIADGKKSYIDADWLRKQEWWYEKEGTDITGYEKDGLFIPTDILTEDTLCIADFNTNKAEYILFKGKFNLLDFYKHIIQGEIDYVHKENTEEGYAIAIHTKYNGEERTYLVRYGQDTSDLWLVGLTDQYHNRFYQFGFSELMDFELTDLSDLMTDAELELCACGCDDVLGTCTEDEDCNDPIDGCIDDITILD